MGAFICCKLKFICALRETDVLPSMHAHTSSDCASVFSVLDEISGDLCARHKPLERPSDGSRTVLVMRKEEEGREAMLKAQPQPSYEEGCYGDLPQICRLMKARQSAAAHTHTL